MESQIGGLENRLKFSRRDKEVTVSDKYLKILYNALYTPTLILNCGFYTPFH